METVSRIWESKLCQRKCQAGSTSNHLIRYYCRGSGYLFISLDLYPAHSHHVGLLGFWVWLAEELGPGASLGQVNAMVEAREGLTAEAREGESEASDSRRASVPASAWGLWKRA